MDFPQPIIKPKPSTLEEFPPDRVNQIARILESHGFVMKERIGCGGFSVIFRVHSLKYDNDFAAKITNSASKRHRTSSITGDIEENALQHLNHPNIIKLYESFHEDNLSFLILELCSSKSLRNIIGKNGIKDRQCLYNYMKQLADALLFCHNAHFVHRDIKPTNVLVDKYGRLKLADFGMCIEVEPGTKLHDYAGSLQYLAPEIINKEYFDPYKTDIWALGVTFYEMAVGPIKWPKDKALIVATIADGGIFIKKDTPPKVSNLVRKMTDMLPERRPMLDQVMQSSIFSRATAAPEMNKNIKMSEGKSPSQVRLSLAQRSFFLRGNTPTLSRSRQRSFAMFQLGPIIDENGKKNEEKETEETEENGEKEKTS